MNDILSKLPPNWYVLLDDDRKALFEGELYGEVDAGHPLFGLTVRAIARRDGYDDFLFLVETSPPQLAAVHLTWVFARSQRPDRPPWPATFFYSTVEEWLKERREDWEE